MSNLLVNTRDQQFVLFEQFEVEKLLQSEPYNEFTREDLLMTMQQV